MNRYLFKGIWRATSILFWVEAKNEAHAVKKAERTVKRMEGGMYCEDLIMLRVEAENV